MNENMTQNERLDYLVEEFKADSVQYKDFQTPMDTEGKRRILRSLMNIRMPRNMDEAVLAVQNEYLRERIRENGIVEPADIPIIRDRMSIWQGDITRLAADAIVIGAGANTPVIIKYPFWQMTNDNPKAVYACVNYNEAFCPKQIEEQSICLEGDAGVILDRIK